MKRAVLYLRVSTVDQHPETQGIELRQFAKQRGYEIVEEYVDHGISGTKVRRPALDHLLKDAEADRLIGMHRRAYPRYWEFVATSIGYDEATNRPVAFRRPLPLLVRQRRLH